MTTPGLPDDNNSTAELPRLPDDVPALRLGVPDRDITAATLALCTLTGWPVDQLIGRSVGVLWAPAERDAISRRFDEVVLLGRDRFGALAVSPDGEPVAWVEIDAKYDYRGGQRIEVTLHPVDRPLADPADVPITDVPIADAPTADAPIADAPNSDPPIADAPITDADEDSVQAEIPDSETGRRPSAARNDEPSAYPSTAGPVVLDGAKTIVAADRVPFLEGPISGVDSQSATRPMATHDRTVPLPEPPAAGAATAVEDDRTVALVMAAMGTAGVPALAVTPDGAIASVTSQVEELVGTPVARLRGQRFEDLFRMSDTAADALSVARAGRMRQTVLAGLADGDRRVVLEWVPGYSAGAGIGVLSEEDAESGEAEEQRLQSRLVSFVAHDVRESLAAVYCGLRTLEAELPPDAPQRLILDKTLAESSRANRIVDDVLAVSRPGRLTRVELDLADVLRETLDRYRQRAAANHVEIVERLAKGIMIPADLGSLERGFGNLFENSLQASPNQGTLTISVRLEDRGQPGVRVTVADTGVGIKPDILPNVFEPFVTNKPQGTGLGLPIARRVVLDHEGQIDCETEEGKGTKFHVWLPRVD